MADDELVSLEVTKLVFEHFGYQYNESKSSKISIVFDNFKPPFRRGMPQISFDLPELTDDRGMPAYRESKLVDVIAFIQGFASMGEALAIIRMEKQRLI